MCHHARHHRFDRDLRERERSGLGGDNLPAGDLRIGDADRDRAAELLRVNAAEGRLTTDELEQRLEGAYAAKTGRELRAPLADLPPARSPRRARTRPVVPVVPLGIMVLIAAAAASGAWWLLWMIWPLMVFAPRYV
jgi:hypothetical protein